MADKKEIVLQKCKNAIDCGEPITDYGFYYEVIALLKEQEKKKFFVDSDGKITPLPDVVRCKECIHRGKAEKCVLAAIAAKKDIPLFMLDNHGEWYCADGKREAEEEKTERNEENVR